MKYANRKQRKSAKQRFLPMVTDTTTFNPGHFHRQTGKKLKKLKTNKIPFIHVGVMFESKFESVGPHFRYFLSLLDRA